MSDLRSLRSGFLTSVQQFPQRPALEVDGACYSYQQLWTRAAGLAATLQAQQPHSQIPLTSILAERSLTAYAAILAALLRGHGYVPLNPSFPIGRTRTMLDRSLSTTLIVDQAGRPLVEELLDRAPRPMLVVLPEEEDVATLRSRFGEHRFVGCNDLAEASQWQETEVDPQAIAYLLFTSGSTGIPKGVMVSHANIVTFLDAMQSRYQIREDDRLTQIFELVFDLSLFDMFVAWNSGACVCVPDKADLLMPDQFVESSRPTVWFSVPSTALLMRKLGKLQPGAFPDLRVSLFCGEALTADVAQAWAEAAPRSIVENLYGPTELTLACTLYRWDPTSSPQECENGIVPIGAPYPNMQPLVVDESLREVAPGEVGELLMAGPQVALGYWQDVEKTAAAFVVPPGQSQVFYRTGDRVRRPLASDPLRYLGRMDHQVQVHGYRVELGEVEAALRDASGADLAVVIGWPLRDGRADRLIGFLARPGADLPQIQKTLRQNLPHYMVPREIRLIEAFPLNSNGKVDRKRLAASLEPVPTTP